MSSSRDVPPRPYLPPLFFAAALLVLLDYLLMKQVWEQYQVQRECLLPSSWVVCCFVFAIALYALGQKVFCERGRFGLVLKLGSLFVVGAVISVSAWSLRMQQSHICSSRPVSAYIFTVVSDSSLGDRGYTCTVEAWEEDAYAGRMRLTGSRCMQRGDVFSAIGRISELGDSDWAQARFMKGEIAAVNVVRYSGYAEGEASNLLMQMRRRIIEILKPETSSARALLAGVLCGYSTDIARDGLRDDFARAGVSHLIAVSGSHLAVVAVCVQEVLRRFRMPRRVTLALTALILVLFALFTGASASAIRSACMVACGCVASGLGRRRHALSSLSIAATMMLCLNPGLIFDLGFQLSALSVLGINLFSAYVVTALRSIGLPAGLSETLGLTLVAQLMTLPITIPVFGQLSLIAPVANIFAVPCITLMLSLGVAFMAVSFLPHIAGLLLVLLDALAQASLFIVRTFAKVPLGCVSIGISGPLCAGLLVAGILLYAVWPVPKRRPILLGCVCIVLSGFIWIARWTLFAHPSVTVMDVGQADSILVREGNHAVLIDAGVDDQVIDALIRNNVFYLDAVVVTHWDADHWGGLPDVLARYPVGSIVVARGAKASMPSELLEYENRVVEMDCNDTLMVGGFSCREVWPRDEVQGEENEDSLTLLVRYEDASKRELSVLLTGDTEVEQEEEYAPAVGDIDVLKLGHHGSAKSINQEILDTLRPEVAIASAGAGNSYGHPTEECIEAVQEYGVAFYCTISSGDVVVSPADGGISVRCSQGASATLE